MTFNETSDAWGDSTANSFAGASLPISIGLAVCVALFLIFLAYGDINLTRFRKLFALLRNSLRWALIGGGTTIPFAGIVWLGYLFGTSEKATQILSLRIVGGIVAGFIILAFVGYHSERIVMRLKTRWETSE